ncbi:Calcium-transporting ATPase 3, endoplasmic reticulum-type [Vitis vinifera]|uniref:Calcium-transporting ATPase 3, endoplasmic reticulum-type n=1 Tax=Vitis vinifera TaxID=29760 RepID=A0A438F819_VITVI|nr:Calcium-transporting ATPase 3, endoplasmic reticulum-type [Vitis vinifera]
MEKLEALTTTCNEPGFAQRPNQDSCPLKMRQQRSVIIHGDKTPIAFILEYLGPIGIVSLIPGHRGGIRAVCNAAGFELAIEAHIGIIGECDNDKRVGCLQSYVGEELRAYQADIATVLRNGCFSILPATDLVPGDIVEVSVGCKIPADMRMIEMLSNQLRVDQAILTGLNINLQKSEMVTVGVERLASSFRCKVGNLPTLYLALPLRVVHNSCVVWGLVEQRFKNRLASWKK